MDLVLRKYLLHVALMGVLLAVGTTEGPRDRDWLGVSRQLRIKAWNRQLYPEWTESQGPDCWRGGHISLKVSNDGPTLIGANASFSIALHFPKSQKVLPDGQVIWANNTIINGSQVWGGQLVYPQEPDDTCIFPDGEPCPSGPLSQKRCFVYVWKTWGSLSPLPDDTATLVLEKRQAPLDCVLYRYGSFSLTLDIVQGIESAEILQAVSSSEGDAFELTVSCQGGLPKEACMDISSPGCQLPAQRLCQPVPPSPACQLVLHQVLKGGSGTYCLNVSLADANSLAMVSTQLVMPGQEAGLRQAPLFVGILLVLTALLLASLIYRRRLMKQGSAVPLPQLPHGRTQWLRLPWVFRSCPIGESKPLLSGQQV